MNLLTYLTVTLLFTLCFSQRCGEECNFRICRANEFLAALLTGARIRPGSPGLAIAPFICTVPASNAVRVSTGEPMVETATGFVPMKSWSAATPDSFPRKFFRGTKIKVLDRTGIIFKKPTGNQWSLLDDRCIKLPIMRVDGVKLLKDPGNCVAFKMVAPAMQITASWNTDDDIDMSVREPDTESVIPGSPSTGGFHRGNNNKNVCGLVKIGREVVIYETECKSGTYCVTLKMKKKCTARRVRYQISVAKNGCEIAKQTGATKASSGEFEEFCFTI